MKIFGKELKFNGKRVYHENDKPTPSEIGAAASSHTHNYLALSGGTLTGSVKNSLNTGTWLAGNQGTALLSSTNTAGNFTTLIKSNSTNGYFGLSNYQNGFHLTYTAKTTVDAGTNTTTKQAVLLNESGNTTFPGTVTASGGFSGNLTGNANTATRLSTARTIKIGNTARTFNGTADITWTAADIGVASINDSATATGSVWSSSKTQTQINTSYNTMNNKVEALEETMYSEFVSASGDTMTGDLTIKRPDGGASKIKVYRTINSKEIEASLDIYNENGGSASLSTWNRTGNVQTGSYIFGGNALWADNTSSGTRPDLGKSSHRFGKAWFDRLDAVNGIYTAGDLIVNGGTTYLSSTILANNHSLYGKKTDGTNHVNICGVDSSNNIYLGWGNETYINLNNTMRAYRDIHVLNGAAMRVTGHLNVARTTDYAQLATYQTAGDGNAQGDGQTHIGYYQAGLGGYTHYFRGGGPTVIDSNNSLQITRDWFRLGGKYVYLRSSAPSSGLQTGDIWIQN